MKYIYSSKMQQQKLRQLKTDYDMQAGIQIDKNTDINHQKIFQIKRQIEEKNINYSNYVSAITENNFAMEQLKIQFLQSQMLNNEPKFKQIKRIFTNYNQQIKQCGFQGYAIKGLHLRPVVMNCMLKFMRIMMLAPDIIAKKKILQISYYWFINNLNPKSNKKKKSSLEIEIRNMVIKNKLIPLKILNIELPSQKISQQLQDYRDKARTIYHQIDPPKEELENYYTHKVAFMQKKYHNVNNQSNHCKANRMIFKRPFIMKESKSQISEQQNQINRQNIEDNRQQIEGTNIGECDEGQVDNQEIIEDKQQLKSGKLDPLVKKFILKRQQKQLKMTKNEYEAVNILDQKLNKKQINDKEDKDNAKYVQDWSKKRARFKSELSRKIQSVRGLNPILRGKNKDNSEKKQNKFIENDIDTIIANTALNQHKRLFKNDLNHENLNTEKGLSLFDRRRVRTQASQKPFSSIIEDKKRMNQTNESIDQIQSIRAKFLKSKIYTPYIKLKQSLIHPTEKQYSTVTQQSQKLNLPIPQMISNPFIKVAKKKKKKKKK